VFTEGKQRPPGQAQKRAQGSTTSDRIPRADFTLKRGPRDNVFTGATAESHRGCRKRHASEREKRSLQNGFLETAQICLNAEPTRFWEKFAKETRAEPIRKKSFIAENLPILLEKKGSYRRRNRQKKKEFPREHNEIHHRKFLQGEHSREKRRGRPDEKGRGRLNKATRAARPG